MSLPSAVTPPEKTTVTWTCPRCNQTATFPEGERCPPCGCADLLLSEKTDIDVYQRVSETKGSEFFAIAYPLGERPVRAFADNRDGAIKQVKRLLDV